ncbi:MAG: hypothetical protein V1789_10365 [PVC group bacterium]
MKPKPVRRYGIPAYPTRLQVLADPNLLEKHIPANWLSTPELAGAVAIFLAANTCVNAGEKELSTSSRAAVVAPIFEYGEGRGATGCVVVSPPVFLSEEEALQVIVEELTNAGVEVTGTDVVLEGVTIPQRIKTYQQVEGKLEEKVEEIPGTEPLSVDIKDDRHRIGVEFVSKSDYFKLGGAMSASTVQDYDFKQVAGGVAKAVGQKGNGIYFGTFYDPAVPMNWESLRAEQAGKKRWEAAKIQGGAEAKRLLRQQVQGFIDWLKGQGAI